MKTQSLPNHLPEPPPEARHAFQLDLLDGDRHVGWLRPDVIGFTGFASATEAAHASWVAYRTLARRLAHRDRRRPLPIDTEPLRLVAEDDGYVIMSSRDRIARLVEPAVTEPTEHGFGFELWLDHPLDEVSARARAYQIYRTLRRSGLRWSMWRPIPEPPVAKAAVAVQPVEVTRVDDQRILGTLVLFATLAAVAVVSSTFPGKVASVAAAVGIAGLMMLRLTVPPFGRPNRGARQAPREPVGRAGIEDY